jgi:hypothetical protein
MGGRGLGTTYRRFWEVRMRAKEWDVFVRAVEEGVVRGINRLYKYHDSDSMTHDQILESQDQLVNGVINSVCEWFEFEPSLEED